MYLRPDLVVKSLTPPSSAEVDAVGMEASGAATTPSMSALAASGRNILTVDNDTNVEMMAFLLSTMSPIGLSHLNSSFEVFARTAVPVKAAEAVLDVSPRICDCCFEVQNAFTFVVLWMRTLHAQMNSL
eukprot:10556460-Ditylum_brightwellii.AAC.1